MKGSGIVAILLLILLAGGIGVTLWRKHKRAASGADKKLITGVSVFDVFEGASLGEGKKSVAIEVTIQPTDKTLTDEEIDAISRKIVENVEKSTGGVLRG